MTGYSRKSHPDAGPAAPAIVSSRLRDRALSASATVKSRLLQVSSSASLLASSGAVAAFLALSLLGGSAPAPLYSIPALLCGWGRCNTAATAILMGLTAWISAAGTQSSSAVNSLVTTILVLAAIWWSSLTVRRAYDEERKNARLDGLTGCLALRSFHEALGSKLEAAREQARPVALAYIDLDHFKDVNDQYGHAVGDELLKEFSAALTRGLLPQDVVGRLGGDEFAVLLAEVHGPCAVHRFEQLVREILGRQAFPVTASIGALIIDPGATVSQSELIVMTDQLMYEAKRSGKATLRTHVIEPAPAAEASLAA